METVEIDNGGSLAMRGVLATLFGVAAVFWPDITIVTVLYLFSAFILINGVVDLVVGVGQLFSNSRALLSRVLVLLLGLVQIGVGVYLLRHPQVSFATLILLIGFTLIFRGIVEVMQGLFEEGPSPNRILMVFIGLLTALAGIVMLFQPVASGVAFVWVLGLYALITGPLLIAIGLQKHKANTINE